jgi:hypothetical protein
LGWGGVFVVQVKAGIVWSAVLSALLVLLGWFSGRSKVRLAGHPASERVRWMASEAPLLVIIEGLTGSGKSTLAHFIARQLRYNGL